MCRFLISQFCSYLWKRIFLIETHAIRLFFFSHRLFLLFSYLNPLLPINTSMHTYFIYGLCALAMNLVGALWFGPVFGPAWISQMAVDKSRRFDRWATQYSFCTGFLCSTFSNAVRIAVIHQLLGSLKLLLPGLTQEAFLAVTTLHVGMSLTLAAQSLWEHRPWRLVIISQAGMVAMTYAGTAALLYLVHLKL